MPVQRTDDSKPICDMIKLHISKGYNDEIAIYSCETNDIESELAIDNICDYCNVPPLSTGYNATSKDNTILFLIIIFLMIIFSWYSRNKNLQYTICDGGYNW